MAEATVKTVFGRLKVTRDTTEHWNAARNFMPYAGEVIVYTDYKTKVVDEGTLSERTIEIPGVKIGSGNAYVQDLAFIGDYEAEQLLEHINNGDIHVTLNDKTNWNNKLNVDDYHEVVTDGNKEILVFNRN